MDEGTTYMRLLFITDRFHPLVGGGEEYIFNLAKELVKRGHKVHVFTPFFPRYFRYRPILRPKEELDGITVYRFSPIITIHDLPLIICLKKIVERDVHVVHISGPSLNEEFLLPFLRTLGYPIVITYHADFSTRNLAVSSYYLLKSNVTYKLANCLIVTTRKYAEILRWRGVPEGKIRVIPPGVDENFFTPPLKDEKSRLKMEFNVSGSVILFVGGLDTKQIYKHPELLIHAFKLLTERGLKGKLVMVGDGNMRSYYQVYCRNLGLDEKVLFTGYVRKRLLANLYKMADVLVLPSPTLAEGFGTVLLEAMASGCPVVTTSGCGGSEAVTETGSGLVVKPWDIVGLARAINRILSDQTLARTLGESGRRAIEQTYGIRKISERTMRIYLEISQ